MACTFSPFFKSVLLLGNTIVQSRGTMHSAGAQYTPIHYVRHYAHHMGPY